MRKSLLDEALEHGGLKQARGRTHADLLRPQRRAYTMTKSNDSYNEKFGESLRRVKQFKGELKTADPTRRANLLNAWKEEIIHNLIDCLNVTEDLEALGMLDITIAAGFPECAR
jgi:hypothetical protein